MDFERLAKQIEFSGIDKIKHVFRKTLLTTGQGRNGAEHSGTWPLW